MLAQISGIESVRTDEPMALHTSFKVGGPADILVKPTDIGKLADTLRFCSQNGIPFFVMGNGTNLVVKDKGIRGVVIKLFDNFNSCQVRDDVIEAQAGILLSKLSNRALENSLTGLEFASGIPGTLGGAAAMNAGAYGGEMKDVIVKTEYMTMNGEIRIVEGDQHKFGYRTSFIQSEDGIILKCMLKLKKGNYQEIKASMAELTKKRCDKQPIELPSAGSVFKRPTGYFAGKLIEDSGLRGFRIGGAEVSEKHCGFIVNRGGATARDVINLIKHVQDTVKSKYNVELQTEVKIVGEE
ncbi:MAG: UDP-N-acetylmuramate dehydrogenase [Bacillota bacterium]|nr:UDP-N-acetylmuramate dehydrogenase [Bacillota bacterium]